MKTRLITAGVAVVVAITLIVLSSFFSVVATVALSLVSVIMCGELLSAKKLNKELKLFIPSLAFALLIPLLSGIKYVCYIPLFLFVFGACVLSVVFHRSIRTEDLMFTLVGVTMITVSMSALNILVVTDASHAAFWIVFCLGVPWIADSAAYFVGSYLGKHKLCPEISPHKTVEGAIGGILGGTLSSLLIGGIFNLIYGEVTVYYGVLVLIGFLNSIISIFGDLTFSVVKRSCKIKDFGSIMPGHGGLMDRFDSVIFCIPVVYIFSQFFYLCV
ncbi:MAG: phosphatidate cytidylyltransferase [Ruminococcus sp.]|nr:phosphatidate cytidylyltransferase [Ruminococcus sp.]